MGFLDKVKNMFIEEVEDDEIKKEVIQVKIPTPEKKEEVSHEYEPNPKYDSEYVKPTLEEVREIEKTVEKKKEEIKEYKQPLPKFFDDSDFEMPTERKINPYREEYKEERVNVSNNNNNNNNRNITYGIKKETKKTFTPTPIISPVYGVLDKNYKKEEISSKKKTPTTIYSRFDKIDVDDIRKKAYGTLEDELESNLSSRDAIVFNDEIDINLKDDKEITDYEEQPLDIFKELDKKDALDELLNSYEINDVEVPTKDTEELVERELNRDYMSMVEEDTLEEDTLEDELSRDYDSYDDDLNDSDLFNLIDSMYSKEENE